MYKRQQNRCFYCLWVSSIDKKTNQLCIIDSVLVWASTANKAKKMAAEILYAPKIMRQILAHDLDIPYQHYSLKESAEFQNFKNRF